MAGTIKQAYLFQLSWERQNQLLKVAIITPYLTIALAFKKVIR